PFDLTCQPGTTITGWTARSFGPKPARNSLTQSAFLSTCSAAFRSEHHGNSSTFPLKGNLFSPPLFQPEQAPESAQDYRTGHQRANHLCQIQTANSRLHGLT